VNDRLLIDLHLHTTASDGRSSPHELVREAAAVGLTAIAVTDHDTTNALAAVKAAAAPMGIACVPGIEITAVHHGRDVHVLAYFIDAANSELARFLEDQREDRRRRLFEMADALDRIGAPIDREAIQAANTDSTRAPGRPILADLLVRAGHVRTIPEAFTRFLGTGRPAFVSRRGASPADVVALVARAGGVASMAHPGKVHVDHLIPELVRAGLGAVEVYHPDHDQAATARYRELAREHDLLVTGGSDYHGPGSGREAGLGQVTLPPQDYERLINQAGWAGTMA
jgi:3',5'-nucleoside bisphosphate phosphatase